MKKIKYENYNLYHYTSLSTLLAIIQNKTIRLSDYRFLNDKQELTYAIERLKEIAQDQSNVFSRKLTNVLNDISIGKAVLPFTDESTDNLAKSIDNPIGIKFQKYDLSYYVLSLSEKCDDLAMWKMYAKLGCCIKFNSQILLEYFHNIRDRHFLKGICNICYGKIRYDESIDQQIHNFMKFENQISNLDINLYDGAWRWCLLNKCNSFAYEKEFRIAIPFSPKFLMGEESYKFIITDGFIKPQIEFNNFPVDNVIEEIVISPYLDTKLVQMGIEEVLKSEKIENVTIRSSDIQIR